MVERVTPDAEERLKEWAERHKAGNKAAVPEGLYLCLLNDLPIPSWLMFAYLKAFRDVVHYRAKSWDDVFGKPHPKGTHLEARKQFREKSVAVYNRITDILQADPETPIDGWLFERVGLELGIGGKTLTEEYYYHWKNRMK